MFVYSYILLFRTSELTVTMSIASSDSSNTTEINSIALSSKYKLYLQYYYFFLPGRFHPVASKMYV